MKNKIFSIGIYKEMLRQLSVIGFITLAVSIFASVIPIINGYSDGNVQMVTLSDMNTVLPFICQIVSPWMALIAFGYGNKRKNADFYHALPYTRECVYLSIYAAVITWMALIVAVSSVISLTGYSMMPSEYIINYGGFFVELIGMAVVTAFAVSAVSIACALTGTTLMNVLVSALILFVPGIVTTILSNAVCNEAPILMEEKLGLLGITKYNMYFGNLSGSIFGIGNYGAHGASILYTLAVALLYGVLACVLFKHRKSETAHNSAPTKLLQAVFRIAFGFVILLWAVMDIVIYGFDPSYLIWIALCTIAYFAFELITTKKWKNLVGAIWGWFVVLGMCTLAVVTVILTVNGAYAFQPDADDIDSVRIGGGFNSYYGGSRSEDFYSYACEKASDVEIRNDEISRIIADALKDNAKDIGYRNAGYQHYEFVPVAVKTGGIVRYRQLYIELDDYNEMIRILGENEEYRDCFTKLPEIRDAAFYYYNMYRQNTLAFDDAMYTVISEEISEVDFFSWYKYLSNSYNESNRLVLVTKEGLNSRTVSLPVSIEYSPDTYSYLRNLYMDKQENRDKCVNGILEMAKESPKNFEEGFYKSEYLEIKAKIMVDGHYVPCEESFNKENGEWYLQSGEEYSEGDFQKLCDILVEVKNMSLQTGSFLEVTYQCYDNYKDGEDVTAFFAIPEEYEEYFLKWRNEYAEDEVVDSIVEY